MDYHIIYLLTVYCSHLCRDAWEDALIICPLFVYFVNQYAIPTSVRFLGNLFTDLFVNFLLALLNKNEITQVNNTLQIKV